MRHRRQRIVHSVHFGFQKRNVFLFNFRDVKSFLAAFEHCFCRVGGQNGSQCKKSILDMCQNFLAAGIDFLCPDQSQIGIELIHSSIAFNTNVMFRNPRAAEKGSSASIAGFCVYFHYWNLWFIVWSLWFFKVTNNSFKMLAKSQKRKVLLLPTLFLPLFFPLVITASEISVSACTLV